MARPFSFWPTPICDEQIDSDVSAQWCVTDLKNTCQLVMFCMNDNHARRGLTTSTVLGRYRFVDRRNRFITTQEGSNQQARMGFSQKSHRYTDWPCQYMAVLITQGLRRNAHFMVLWLLKICNFMAHLYRHQEIPPIPWNKPSTWSHQPLSAIRFPSGLLNITNNCFTMLLDRFIGEKAFQTKSIQILQIWCFVYRSLAICESTTPNLVAADSPWVSDYMWLPLFGLGRIRFGLLGVRGLLMLCWCFEHGDPTSDSKGWWGLRVAPLLVARSQATGITVMGWRTVANYYRYMLGFHVHGVVFVFAFLLLGHWEVEHGEGWLFSWLIFGKNLAYRCGMVLQPPQSDEASKNYWLGRTVKIVQ